MFKRLLNFIQDKFDDFIWWIEDWWMDSWRFLFVMTCISFVVLCAYANWQIPPKYLSREEVCIKNGGHLSEMGFLDMRYGGRIIECMKDGNVVELPVRPVLRTSEEGLH